MGEQPLKVLMALQYYLPHRTGLTLHVQRIAEALATRGHEVTVVTARYDPRLPRDEEVINGVRVIRLWAPVRISRGMIMPAYPWAALRLTQMHDVVSLHVPTLETFVYAAYARLFNKGLVVTHHGDLILPEGALNRFIQWTTFQLYKTAGRTADHIIAYSEDYAARSYYIAPFREKTTPVHPPIAIPTPNLRHAEELRAEWSGNGNETKLIGYAGRFVEEKRPDVLIRALPIIHQQHPGARIIFAGQHIIQYEDFYERNADLIRQYEDYITFLGLIESPQELADFYGAVDVLALPSDTECFALVQVEAMRCGTPVVSTDIPGARVVVRKTGMGEIVPPGDPQAMGEAINRVLADPEQYVKPLSAIDAVFGIDQTVDRYEALLRDAANRPTRR